MAELVQVPQPIMDALKDLASLNGSGSFAGDATALANVRNLLAGGGTNGQSELGIVDVAFFGDGTRDSPGDYSFGEGQMLSEAMNAVRGRYGAALATLLAAIDVLLDAAADMHLGYQSINSDLKEAHRLVDRAIKERLPQVDTLLGPNDGKGDE